MDRPDGYVSAAGGTASGAAEMPESRPLVSLVAAEVQVGGRMQHAVGKLHKSRTRRCGHRSARTREAVGCHPRERLAHNPREHEFPGARSDCTADGLVLNRTAVLPGQLDADIHFDTLASHAVGQGLDRGLGAKFVNSRGSQIRDERAKVRDIRLQLVDGLADRLGHRPRFPGTVCASEDEAQGGETLERLVVQLARPASAFCFSCGQGLAPALVGAGLRGGNGRRSARRKRFQQPLVLAGEPAAVEAIDGMKDAIGPVAKGQRDDQPSPDVKPERAETMLLKARVVDQIRKVLWLTRPQGCADHRVIRAHPLADKALGQLSSAGGDQQLPVALQLDDKRLGGHERASTFGDKVQDRSEIRLSTQQLGQSPSSPLISI